MNKRLTIPAITKLKNIVAIAAYTAPIAKLIDYETDVILVGDSLGMTIYGMDSTLNVTLDMMCNHTKAVANATNHALIIADLPFASYQKNKEQAFKNAAKLMQSGAGAVKLEGGEYLAETVSFLNDRGIPVMGHIGMQPQSFNLYGGYKHQGADKITAKQIIDDAVALEKSGAFAIVIEAVKAEIVKKIKAKISIPLIGIGASDECDGQILVIDDIIGLSDHKPKFVKQYCNITETIQQATKKYSKEVRKKKFPEKKHLY